MRLLNSISKNFKINDSEELTLLEYLELCITDPKAYATPAERLKNAIGPPTFVDTSKDQRLSKIFHDRVIKTYPPFNHFYGIEETIERIVDYVNHAAQGLEESKQILYLLGPVGSAKSTLAKTIMELFESQPFYAIKDSPVNDSPLCLFNLKEHGDELQQKFKISKHRLIYKPSPWLIKKLQERDGDTSWIRIVKRYPSINRQIAMARTEPGDENNQDISTLTGKLDIRKLEKFSPADPDAYSYSGGLCFANRGILEFVEMFKAPIKVLNPLLHATQDHQYNGTEPISSLPFEGIILSHSNEAEWSVFRNDKKNEAFIDRIYIVKVPYCLRIEEEQKIYQKLIDESELKSYPCAPKTLELLAIFSVVSRLYVVGEVKDPYIKARIYNGENMKGKINNPLSIFEYKKEAGVGEGMEGISSRFAFKVLSKTFNFDREEVAANPVHLMTVLSDHIYNEQFDKNKTESLLGVVTSVIKREFDKYLAHQIQTAYLESYSEYGQNIFDNYILWAGKWIDDEDYRDPDTGHVFDRDALDKKLATIEAPAGIQNVSDFRHEVVTFCARVRGKTGENPRWTDYEKIKAVIEKKIFISSDELIPVISFGPKKSEEENKQHLDFVNRMISMGYTEKQVRLLVEYWAGRNNGSMR